MLLGTESAKLYGMKKLLLLSFMVLLIVASSCTKTGNADAFVGHYSVSTIENVTWGNDSGTLTDNGTFSITKVSSTRIQVSGYLNTFGEVVGNSLYLESYTTSDSYGSLTIVFGTGVLNGNVLTLPSTTTGQLKYNGVPYPYHASTQMTCIKQ